jgi:serine/threonine protein kinase
VSPSLQEQLQLALGETYLLERELGGGGMSRVFVAHERALGRRVVVKILLPELAAAVNVERFRREIHLAAQLQHPHIVPLLSAGEAEGLPYFIMPFVTGESLRARITREGEFPIGDTVHILRDVVSALAYAHGFGVIHRDVKPDNVLLSHGVAVVTDFGVAKAISASSGAAEGSGITSAGVALGTPAYMAPEQATASPQIDHRADIYALGVVAYELLTGAPPFAGRNAQATLAAHVVEDPDPVERRRPATPPMLASLVRDCLCKRAADRPQSAAQIMHVLDAIVTPSGGTAATTAVRTPAVASPPTSRRRWVIGAAAIAGLVLAAGALFIQRNRTASDTRAAIPPVSFKDTVTAAARPLAMDSVDVPSPAKPAAVAQKSPKPKPRPAVTPSPPVATPAKDTAAPSSVDSMPVATAAPPPAALTDSGGPPFPAAVPPATQPKPPTPAAPAPPPAPVDQRPAIRNVVSEYAAAIEARNIEGIRRVYPGMTEAQQRGWEQFFQLTRDVKAELALTQVQVANTAAEGLIAGTYTYLNTSNGRQVNQPVSFRGSFRLDNGKWRLVAVR